MTAPAIQGRAQRLARGTTVVERRSGSAVTTWLLPDEHRALESLAKELNTSKSAVMRRLIQDHLALRRSLR